MDLLSALAQFLLLIAGTVFAVWLACVILAGIITALSVVGAWIAVVWERVRGKDKAGD